MPRNLKIEKTVDEILSRIDSYLSGEKLSSFPSSAARKMVDDQIFHPSNSVRLASLFFIFYSVVDSDWDCDSVPIGIRGQYGDKRLARELFLRDITLHNAITAFGENLGWKGNVSAARLQSDPRFASLSQILMAKGHAERVKISNYIASAFASSRSVLSPLPPVSDDLLTYVRARDLFYKLLDLPSEGNVQQFLVAGILCVHRNRYGLEIRTHHVHASDKSDITAGDIEEFHGKDLVAAYEVTARPDWKNRLSDFRQKMDKAGLTKYAIIASGVKSDIELKRPADMLVFLRPYGRDIAVVDLHDFIDVFVMELKPIELQSVIRKTYAYLRSPSLCGRPDIIENFKEIVGLWLDHATEAP